jgi:hypothetical protein
MAKNIIRRPSLVGWLREEHRRLLRIGVISGVILISFLIAFQSTRLPLRLILMMLVGIGAVAVFLNWPPLGVLMILLVGMFVPLVGPGGFNGSILMIALLLGLWILDMVVKQRKIQIVPSRTVLPILVFILICILALGMGQLEWYPFAGQASLDAQLGGFAIYVLSAGAFLLVANRVRDLRWLQVIVWAFILLGGLYVVARLHPVPGRIVHNLYHAGIHSNSMFWIWLVALSFSQAVFNNRLHIGVRAGLVGVSLITLYIALIQAGTWRSGWVPPLITIALILYFRYYRIMWVLVPLALIYGLILVNESIAAESYSWMTRVAAWEIVLNISKVNPLLGMGFGNYYWYTPLLSILGYYGISYSSHSQYVDLIAQVGVLGLACFLWFFWEIGRLSMSLRERVPEGFMKAYVYGVIGGIAGTLVAAALVDWVLPFVYNIGMQGFRGTVLAWIFLGGLVSIEQMVRVQTNPKSQG